MIDRIRSAALRAGFVDCPEDAQAPLMELGVDSLMIVLMVSELEREFRIKIPAAKVSEEAFASLASLETFLKGLGAR